MARRKNTRLSVWLMGASLVLLLLFEMFWLRSEFQAQEKWLAHEQSRFFYSAIRTLEDSLFNEMIFHPLQIPIDSLDFDQNTGKRLHFRTSGDTANNVTIMRTVDMRHREGNYHGFTRDGRRHHRSMLLGTLSMQLSEGQDSASVAANLEELISHKLAVADEDQLPLSYTLTSWSEPDTLAVMGMSSTPYFDVWSKQYYTIIYPTYNLYLFGLIWRQILFAIILFSSIITAFALIYRSLVNQKRLAVMRNDFINNITHELKTPISTVRVALEAIANFNAVKNPERAKEYVEISQNELNRLTLLVDKVLQMSQLNEGTSELKFEKFDLRELIMTTLDTMKVQFSRLSAKVDFVSSGSNFEIEGDKLHLTGVIYNLLDNAMKYRSGTPKIEVSLNQMNGNLTLEVEDNGKGISPAYKDKIFDKFFRVPTGDQHNTKGHGLGLSYVAEVVEQHHGTITVDSKIGNGSKFKLTFPKQHAN
jgi:two-component system, OmpR family, phosphate regulon sensor histidine kinase PhoR